MTTTEFNTTCPHCGKLHEAHSTITGDGAPGPGDISFCFTCGGISAYNADLQLVHLTAEQVKEVDASVDLNQLTRAWLFVTRERKE